MKDTFKLILVKKDALNFIGKSCNRCNKISIYFPFSYLQRFLTVLYLNCDRNLLEKNETKKICFILFKSSQFVLQLHRIQNPYLLNNLSILEKK